MSVLVLVLAGPLQSWGLTARHSYRDTGAHPTKSGVIGMVASSLGLARTDRVGLAELATLSFAVRTDQPGTRMRDFHTTHTRAGKAMPLSDRFYLADAVFAAALGGPRELLERVRRGLCSPAHPLFLGRRSCPPARPPVHSLHPHATDPVAVLEALPWQAADWWQAANPGQRMVIYHDSAFADRSAHLSPDQPLDFSPTSRRYALRPVASCTLPPAPATGPGGAPDFFDALDDFQ
ncbi:type I-E CRISPR-associated protein Cas5/CasD [Streptomyces sp. NPDC056056]|uniref:type I-E CRISPR-associated protein Cas5/CasD n=1 Tax=Streptomyces sp. NPDC056056 TaxID=3345698 RepID=UPI0035DF8E41